MNFYTTHDHSRPIGKRCRVHDALTNNILLEIEGHFEFLNTHYYMGHYPNKAPKYQAVVYLAVEIIDSLGERVWAPTGQPLVTGR